MLADQIGVPMLGMRGVPIPVTRVSKTWRSQQAESFYKAREQETQADPAVAVVLIGAGDIRQIKKAYPNYFLNTGEFRVNLDAALRPFSA